MKHIIEVTTFLALVSSIARAQFTKGDVELSLMGSAGSFTRGTTYAYTGYSSYSETYSSSTNYLMLALACGIYVTDGLSIEPEVGLLAIERSAPGQSIIGNLAYTYLVPGSRIAMFVRGGYGVSNAFLYPITATIPIRWSDKFDIGIINAGAGIKYLITNRTVFKVEMNYRRQSYSQEENYNYMSYSYSSKTESSYSNIGVMIGFSVIL